MSRITIETACAEIVADIRHQMESRAYRSANELRNASQLVLRGQRHGRIYTVPGTKKKYTASAPGEPPAVRTGIFRASWQPSSSVEGDKYVSKIESDYSANGYLLGEILENGTSKMAPRPHHDRIREMAEPDIVRIYSERYF